MPPAPTGRPVAVEEYVIVAVATALVLALTLGLQELPQVANGIGWDDVVYHDMARRVAQGEELSGGTPFIFRIGLPWLVGSLFPDDLRQGFLWFNLPAVVLVGVTFHALLAPHVRQSWARLTCALLFVGAFHGLARFIPFRNFMVDPPAMLFVFGGLLLIRAYRERPGASWIGLLAAWTFVGMWFRETSILPAAALLFAGQPLELEPRPKLKAPRVRQLIPLLSGIVAWLLVRRSVSATGVVGMGDQLLAFVEMGRAKVPFALPLGWAICFGPVLVLAVSSWRDSVRFLLCHQELVATLLGVALLAWAGGSDTERLLFYGAPIVLVLVGRFLDRIEPRRELAWLVPLLALQAISARWFQLLPPGAGSSAGFPFLTVFGDGIAYEQVWSAHMDRQTRLVLLGQHLLFFGVFFLWLRRRASLVSKESIAQPPSARAEVPPRNAA